MVIFSSIFLKTLGLTWSYFSLCRRSNAPVKSFGELISTFPAILSTCFTNPAKSLLYSDQSRFSISADFLFFSDDNNTQGIILNPWGFRLSTILVTWSMELMTWVTKPFGWASTFLCIFSKSGLLEIERYMSILFPKPCSLNCFTMSLGTSPESFGPSGG